MHRRVNPIAPLPAGLGIKVPDPKDGKDVCFEDCFRYAGDFVDGDMKPSDFVEAKGPRKAFLYRYADAWAKSLDSDVKQAEKQLRVTRARGVNLKWYHAEKEAADLARRRFKNAGLGEITVGSMPPSRQPRRR